MEVYIYVYLNRPVITSTACANKHAWMYVDDFKMTYNMIHASVINAHKCICIVGLYVCGGESRSSSEAHSI